MPEKRGRKRRPRDRGTHADATVANSAPSLAPARRTAADVAAVPSNTARATGFAIAVITAFLAIMLIADAFAADRSAIDTALRFAAGVFLVLLGLAVGVLSLFPAQIRRRIRGA
jgi:uncharacterized protein YjeT (DUF2065 family)